MPRARYSRVAPPAAIAAMLAAAMMISPAAATASSAATAGAGTTRAGTAVAAASPSALPAVLPGQRLPGQPLPLLPLESRLPGNAGGREISALTGSPTGSLTGVVLGVLGMPLAGACVTAHGAAGAVSAVTRQDGQFYLPGLRTGQYTLEYRDCAAPGRYFEQWSGGADLPAYSHRVLVTPGRLTSLTAATLQPTSATAAQAARLGAWNLARSGTARVASGSGGGHISGRVTSKAGHPIKGICVLAFSQATGDERIATTTRAGTYRTRSLAHGRYLVAFLPGCGNSGNWLPQIYKNQTDLAKATNVTVRAGKTTAHIDAALRLGGEITGTVVSRSGKKLSGICVTTGGGLIPASGVSRRGKYQVHSVSPGKHKVEFSTGCGNRGNFGGVWWKNALTAAKAATIHVKAGQTIANIDVVMPPGAEISGTVTAGSSSGTPLGGICVFAAGEGAEQNIVAQTATRPDGTYLLKGLSTGRYLVQFFPGCNNNGNFLPANHRGAVRVTDGQVTAGIDGVLLPGGAISGVVTDAHGKPVAGICVDAESYNNSGFTQTAADGSYLVTQLTTGRYTVSFAGGCGNGPSYAPQSYNDVTSGDGVGADEIKVTRGLTKAGINAALQPGGTITGMVTSAAGAKLGGVCVSAMSTGLGSFLSGGFIGDLTVLASGAGLGGGFTASRGGAYRLANLTPGQYTVAFSPGCGVKGNPAQQWFRGQPGPGPADLVSVTPGHPTAGINGVLRPAGSISGVVRSRSGHRLGGFCVNVTPASGAAAPEFTFGQNGSYRIGGLLPGAYHVEFLGECSQGNNASQWYKGKNTAAAASRVVVTAGHTTSGISGGLTKGGSITGHVSAGGHPVRNVCVIASNPQQNFLFGEGLTNRSGSYRIASLNTGSYTLEFLPCNGGRANLAAQVRARPVHVTAGRAVAGINAALVAGGSISGSVRGGSPVTAQPGICVDAVSVHGNVSSESITLAGGAYTIGNLPPGTYRVFIGDAACPFGPYDVASQWYNGQPTEAKATPVPVTGGVTTPGISATLPADGGIFGTVTGPGPAHQPLTGICVVARQVGSSAPPVFAVTSGGSYSVIDASPGRYRVEFESGCGATGYATQWWKGVSVEKKATIINVGASTVTGIDAALRR
jgi:Carboxypeptidase regulatory-like domain